jgi:3-deoxy-manno-octulosonate cytidylyltransferase (CMP-KDO synthetase)
MATIGVIPARFASTRLPGKPLALIQGRTMVEHVYRRAARSARLDVVVVATDDPRIEAAVYAFGGRVVMTSPDHVSGSDRVFEAVRDLPGDVIVNIQGDEPLLDPASIDAVIEPLLADPRIPVATAAAPLEGDPGSPSVVKVVRAESGDALYFSRSPIPAGGPWLHHIGLYAYRRRALADFVARPPGPLERTERLEQLRFLESGVAVRVVLVERAPLSVDTPEELERIRALFALGASDA